PELAGVIRLRDAATLHDDADVVTGASAAEAGDVLDGALSHAMRASRRSSVLYKAAARRASSTTQRSGSGARAKIVQMGRPGAIGSPAAGTSRRSGSASQRSVLDGVTARRAYTTALPHVALWRRGTWKSGSDPAQARSCALKIEIPNARSMSSIEAVYRRLTYTASGMPCEVKISI